MHSERICVPLPWSFEKTEHVALDEEDVGRREEGEVEALHCNH